MTFHILDKQVSLFLTNMVCPNTSYIKDGDSTVLPHDIHGIPYIAIVAALAKLLSYHIWGILLAVLTGRCR